MAAIDAKRAPATAGEVFTYGGRTRHRPRRRRLCREAAAERGAGEILLTSMDRDGAKTGYDLELLKAVTRGRRRAGDRLAAAPATPSTWSTRCSEGGADAVLAASIFHFGEVTIGEAKQAMAAARHSRCATLEDRRMSTLRRRPRAPVPTTHRGAPQGRRPGHVLYRQAARPTRLWRPRSSARRRSRPSSPPSRATGPASPPKAPT